MSALPKQKRQNLSKELLYPPASPSQFEDIPLVPSVAPSSREPRVKDKVVLVTGTNSPLGIGRAAAHLFAANSPRALYLLDYQTEHLATHKRELQQNYPTVPVHTQELDATDEDAVKHVVDSALHTYGRVDVMFANAGIVGAAAFQDLGAEDFMRVVRGNLLSAFLCAKHAALAMQRTGPSKAYPGGSIIMTASTAGLRSNAGGSDYSAAKAGIVSLAQTLSYQLAGTGVRVNAVCPGIIETGMTRLMYEMARQRGTERKIGQLNPLQRGGVADEVARVALFLGSDESSYVNGQAWAVDGGLSAGHPFVPGKLA